MVLQKDTRRMEEKQDSEYFIQKIDIKHTHRKGEKLCQTHIKLEQMFSQWQKKC